MNAEELEPTHIVEKNALGVEYNTACLVGTRLKEAREEASYSTEYVAKKAKIRERYIDAIELGDWDILPPGLNGRGLVRLYAKELGVSLPEFEEFSHLPTIQAEKQSENLSHHNFTKKSRYQPAAEESAEIIKIVPRSQFKNTAGDENISSHFPNSRDSNSSSINNKVYHTQTHHTAAVVTPKITEIIQVDLSMLSAGKQEENKNDNPRQKKSNPNHLTILPLAKPIHISEKLESFNTPPPINQIVNLAVELKSQAPIQKDQSLSNSHSPTQPVKTDFHLNKYIKQAISYILIVLAVSGIIYSLYRMNSKDRKLDSQPLLTSERQLIHTNEQGNASQPNVVPEANSSLGENTNLQAAAIPTPPVIQAPVAVERSAKVDILARVKLQVEADGKEVFSGYHQPGSLEFNFKDKAEILVYDASKVKLTYGAWDHGELGWNERKRKITLNAKPYEE